MMHRFLIMILNYSNYKQILPKKNNDTLKKSYIPFNEIKQGLQNNCFHFNCSTLQQMQNSKNVFFSFNFQVVSLFYSIKPHTRCFYIKKQPPDRICLSKNRNRCNKQLRLLTKILFQLGIEIIALVYIGKCLYL